MERFRGRYGCEGKARLTEWVGHAEGVAVCFDEIAAFDVGLEVQVGD